MKNRRKTEKKKRNIATANHDTEIMQNELAENKLRKMHFKLNIHYTTLVRILPALTVCYCVCVRERYSIAD